MIRYRALVLAFVLLGLALPAVGAEWSTDLTMDLSERYDDNIFRTQTNRVYDYISGVTPGITVTGRGDALRLDFFFAPTFNFYAQNSDQNYTGYNGTINALVNMTQRTNLLVTGNYVRSQDIAQLLAVPGIGTLPPAQVWDFFTVSAQLSHLLTERFSVLVGGGYQMQKTNSDTANNTTTYSGYLGLSYKVTPALSLGLKGTYLQYDYKLTPNWASQEYVLSADYKFNPTLSMNLSGGINLSKPDISGGNWDSGFLGNLSVTKTFERPGQQLTVYINQSTTAGFTNGVPQEGQSAGVSFSMPLTEHLGSNLTASYGKYKSIKTDLTNTDQIAVGAGLTYSFSSWGGLNLTYSYFKYHDKNTSTADYVDNLVMLMFRLKYSIKL